MASDDIMRMALDSLGAGEDEDEDSPEGEVAGPTPDALGAGDDIALYDYLSAYNYTAGVEYCLVERKHPTMFRGCPTGGRLEQLYEPVSESDLAAKWGGGTYLLKVYQLRGNASRQVGVKLVTIAGQPTYYPGADGSRVPLPGVELAQRSERLFGGEGLHAGSGLTDRLRERQSEARAQTDALREVRQASDASNQILLETLRQQQAALAAKERAAAEQAAAMAQPFQAAIGAVQSQAVQQANSMQIMLEGMRNSHQAQINALMAQMQQASQEATRREQAVREEADRREKSLRDDFQFRLSSQLEQQRQGYEAQIREANARAQAEKDRAERAVSEERAHAGQTTGLTTKMLEAQYQGQIAILQSELRRLEASAAESRAELDRFRTQALENADPLTAITKAKNLVETLQAEVGSGGDDNLPDGWLGQLAKAAPFVGRALEPVLARVDRAQQLGEQAIRLQAAQAAQAQQAQQAQAQARGLPAPRPTQAPMPGPVLQPPPGGFVAAPGQGPAPPPVSDQAPDGNDPAFVQLLQWLDQQAANNVAPSAVVADIRTGVAAGRVPADFVAELLSASREDVVGNLQAGAEQVGADTLASPFGRDYLAAIYEGLKT